MRLAFDPFPVLLMDDEILYRCFDSMTDPYSVEFVRDYIGEATIEQYKQTEIYIGTYDSFINDEKKNEAVFDVMKHKYVDSRRFEEIFTQLHLLPECEIVAVLLVASCVKVVKVYCYGGMLMYFTDRNTKRTVMSWSSGDFNKFSEADERINLIYDEVYISVFTFNEENYYVEHNEMLDVEEFGKINSFVESELATKGKICRK